MSNGKHIEDHFDNGEEFEDVLDEAEAEASPSQQDFVSGMRKKWDAYGLKAFMTEAQADYLRKIAKV